MVNPEGLDRFERRCRQSPGPCPWSWAYPGRQGTERIVVVAALHGDENAALPVLVDTIDQVEREGLDDALTICVGNPEACRLEKRAMHTDLNRVFNLPAGLGSQDRRRISELRALLEAATIVVDLHQTRDPTPAGFYFLPDCAGSRRLAAKLDVARVAVAFGPNGDFASRGGTAVGHASRAGATALGIELAQIGADEAARTATRRALRRLVGWDATEPRCQTQQLVVGHQEPPNPRVRLRPELENLAEVERGETLGWDSVSGERVACARTGRLLFPDHEGNKTFLYSVAVRHPQSEGTSESTSESRATR